jgi:hypothetical protein
MATHQDLVCDGKPEVKEFLRNRGYVAVVLAYGCYEEILLTCYKFLN